ncbi:MAG: hypothetical protein V2B18_18455 [Pseudomonadota bacterium]
MGKRTLSGREIVDDIRSGMSAHELMEKYRLSQNGLMIVTKKVTSATGKSPADLYGRSVVDLRYDDDEAIRFLPRQEIPLPLKIGEVTDPRRTGVVRDVTEQGFGSEGVETRVGEVAAFVVACEEYFQIPNIIVEAVCRWNRREGPDMICVSGFEITRISEDNRRSLQQLVLAIRSINPR